MTTSSFISRVNIFHKLLTQTINKTKSKIATRRVNRLLKMCRTGGVLSPVIVTDIVDFCYTLGDRSHDHFQLKDTFDVGNQISKYRFSQLKSNTSSCKNETRELVKRSKTFSTW